LWYSIYVRNLRSLQAQLNTIALQKTKTLSRFSVLAVLLISLAAMTGCATSLSREAETLLVPEVDLERYAGLWYQVGRYPNSFQTGDCGDSTAEYSLREDGTISVLNRCWTDEYGGEYSQQVRAVGKPMDESGSWLRVVFFKLFPASYLIIELDGDNYQWAAVSTPAKRTLWILSRTPALPPETYEAIVASLAAKGFDPEKITRTSRQK
jgi:apolipoprotein D and lipocalin family protein